MPSACGSARVHAFTGMPEPVHMFYLRVWAEVWASAWCSVQAANACGLFNFGMDDSQNTHTSSEMRREIRVPRTRRGDRNMEAEQNRKFNKKGEQICCNVLLSATAIQQNIYLLVEGKKKKRSVTHRKTVILNAGLPRVPWGRTPGAIRLLLGILKWKIKQFSSMIDRII